MSPTGRALTYCQLPDGALGWRGIDVQRGRTWTAFAREAAGRIDSVDRHWIELLSARGRTPCYGDLPRCTPRPARR